jgi:hypothetical protein
VIGVALVLALSLSGGSTASAALPKQGVLAPHRSLAGVRLGDTQAAVRARWGRSYRLCTVCARPTWMYTYRTGSPVGAAVTFRGGRVAAVFTLGSPLGWRTTKGLAVGDDSDTVDDVYGRLTWHRCLGYGALSMRRGSVVTSIYTEGEKVYGFALTRPGEPVCQ